MSERDEQRLEDILRAIDSILRHRPDDLTQLLDDEPLQSHVKLKLQIHRRSSIAAPGSG